jgi:ribonuclease Y
MSLSIVLLLAGTSGIIGLVLGYVLRLIISLGKRGSMELEIKEMLLSAREEAKRITTEAETTARDSGNKAKQAEHERELKIEKTEQRLINKEALLDKRQLDIDDEVENLKKKIEEIKAIKEKVDKMEFEKTSELQKISGLTKEDAKETLIKVIEKQHEEDLSQRIAKFERNAEEKLDRKAKDILATVIQRLATSVASDVFSTSVTIPSEEVKGKIIGKEGRNIKAFERMSGVEVIVDDTPGTITLSSFDSVRRHIAKQALEVLISDGRIQPARIEQAIEKAKQDVNKIIKEKGEAAAYECGVFNLDPRLILVLGRLHFRTSYGQNVLQHSIEMTHIAGMLAEELDANVQIAKAGALLHDIGKAIDHEVQGSHVEIGIRILQKFGASEDVIKAMRAHHEEYPYETIESIIVQTADAISGSRPGARRDSVENYLKRLGDLEALANSFPGVEKSYALQAGREIRVFVKPEDVSDLEAQKMAREMAIKIEQDLKYPGEIKITLIRENRVIEFAR